MSEAEAEAQQTQAEVKAEDGNAPINVKVRFFSRFMHWRTGDVLTLTVCVLTLILDAMF